MCFGWVTLETKLEHVESYSGLGLASSCCYIQQQHLGGALGLHPALKNNLNNNIFKRGHYPTMGDRHDPKPIRWPSVQILD